MARVTILLEGYVKNDGENVQSTISLVQDGETNIVIDPGMAKDFNDVIRSLSKVDIKPEDIGYVFLTHHHPDHTINTAKFPKAKVIDYNSIYEGDIWLDTGGEYQLTPNVRIVPTPGHTKEDATLFVTNVTNVENNKDVTVAICHLWWFEGKQHDPLAEDYKELLSSRIKILKVANYIVPGHGAIFKNNKIQSYYRSPTVQTVNQ